MRRGLSLLFLAGLMTLVLVSCGGKRYEGKIIAVELPGDDLALEGARLVLLDPDHPDRDGQALTGDLASAAAPSLSHNARYLFFQGQKEKGDPWQIWVIDLKKNRLKQVTDLPDNCTQPASLPDGTVVFSREGWMLDQTKHDLWKCGMDGCCLNRLTYNPADNIHASVNREGRVIYSSTTRYPDLHASRLMIMRPDGTKSELYNARCCNYIPEGGGIESADGYVYFIVSGRRLSRLLHQRPLHTFELLWEEGEFASVAPSLDGSCLVSYRPDGDGVYMICRFDPVSREEPVPLFTQKNYTDPLPVEVIDPRPRILPSAVNPENRTGLLMSQDINHSMLPVQKELQGDTLADRIRISTLDGEVAVVESREDGSVYVKLDADTPYRIETLNSNGETVRGPSDWIYLRPNERRACTGCHADQELAPRNYQPHAVKEDPVVLVSRENETSH